MKVAHAIAISFRATLLGAAMGVNGIPTEVGIPGHGLEGSGMTYRYRSVSVLKAMSATDTAKTLEVTGVVSFAAGRGRLEIVRSTYPGLMRGDYCLFDSSGTVVVRPSSHGFFAFGASDQTRELTREARVTGLTSRVDALGGADTVDGHGTEHYRSRVAYVVQFGAPAGDLAFQSVSASLVTDYWVAKPGEINSKVAPPPQLFQGPLPGDAFAGVRSHLRVVRDSVTGNGFALKTVNVITTRGAGGNGMSVRSTIWISGVAAATVDLRSLVLPKEFVAETGTFRVPPADKDVVRFRRPPQVARSN